MNALPGRLTMRLFLLGVGVLLALALAWRSAPYILARLTSQPRAESFHIVSVNGVAPGPVSDTERGVRLTVAGRAPLDRLDVRLESSVPHEFSAELRGYRRRVLAQQRAAGGPGSVLLTLPVDLITILGQAKEEVDKESGGTMYRYALRVDARDRPVEREVVQIRLVRSGTSDALASRGTPFGLHATGDAYREIAELHASVRRIIPMRALSPDFREAVARLDENIRRLSVAAPDIVVTLVSDLHRSGNEYTLLTDGEREQWKDMVAQLVERYDGDGVDDMPGLTHPITHWQIENEWLWQIRDGNGRPASVADLERHFREIRDVIRRQSPESTIILGAFTGLRFLAFADGYLPYAETGDTDCQYERVTKLPGGEIPLTTEQRQRVTEQRARIRELVRTIVLHSDVIDLHEYDENPLELRASLAWLRQQLRDAGVPERPLWSLENAGPFYFFVALGQPKPTDCRTTSYPGFYDPALHAADLVKRYAIALAAGIDRVYYSSLVPTKEWSANYQRLALVDARVSPHRKPAFYTYKLLTEELAGYRRVTALDDETYLFTFPSDKQVIVAWRETRHPLHPALETLIRSSRAVRVTKIITRNRQTAPERVSVRSPEELEALIGATPVFIERGAP